MTSHLVQNYLSIRLRCFGFCFFAETQFDFSDSLFSSTDFMFLFTLDVEGLFLLSRLVSSSFWGELVKITVFPVLHLCFLLHFYLTLALDPKVITTLLNLRDLVLFLLVFFVIHLWSMLVIDWVTFAKLPILTIQRWNPLL